VVSVKKELFRPADKDIDAVTAAWFCVCVFFFMSVGLSLQEDW
jgi:hypothetical protein